MTCHRNSFDPLSCVWLVWLVGKVKFLSPPASTRGCAQPWTSFLWGRWRRGGTTLLAAVNRTLTILTISIENSKMKKTVCLTEKKSCLNSHRVNKSRFFFLESSLTYYLSNLSHANNATVLICDSISVTDRGPRIPFEFKQDCGRFETVEEEFSMLRNGWVKHCSAKMCQADPDFILQHWRLVGKTKTGFTGWWVWNDRKVSDILEKEKRCCNQKHYWLSVCSSCESKTHNYQL